MAKANWWWKAINAGMMLHDLRHQRLPRKRRLFACACCRRVWELLTDPRSRAAVEVAERFADGLATPEELDVAYQGARSAALQANAEVMRIPVLGRGRTGSWKLWKAAEAAVHAAAPRGTIDAAEDAADASFNFHHRSAENRAQCALVHDIFGNPFRPVTPDPAWLAWDDHSVERIARGIYDEGRFGDLPILHDALLDAGCDDEAVLTHCRAGDSHVRGCWVLDVLLAKKP